jgi:hypothetical protein
LSTTNPTWPDPGWNPGRRGGKPASTRLSYGAARGVKIVIQSCHSEDLGPVLTVASNLNIRDRNNFQFSNKAILLRQLSMSNTAGE